MDRNRISWRALLAVALISASPAGATQESLLGTAQPVEISPDGPDPVSPVSTSVIRKISIDPVDPGLPGYDSPKLWFRQLIGHSSADELRRVQNPHDPERWSRFFTNIAEQDKDYIFLWHVNGVTEPGGWMQFDWIAEGLVDVDARHICGWRDEARDWLNGEPHRRLVIYIGAPGRGGTDEGEAFESFVIEWILATHPRIEIAFDAGAPTDVDSSTYKWAKRLQARGVRVWVEALVPSELDHWEGFGQVCTDWYYRRKLRQTMDTDWVHYSGPEYDRKLPDVMRETVVFFEGGGNNHVPFAPVAGEPVDRMRIDYAKPWNLYSVVLGWSLTQQGYSWGIESWAADRQRPIVASLPDAPYDGPVKYEPLSAGSAGGGSSSE